MTKPRRIGTLRDARTGRAIVEMSGPGTDDDALSIGLRVLTYQLELRQAAQGHVMGFFGSEFGYGEEFENEVFLMRPHCWCGNAGECPWCTGCDIYQERNACAVCRQPALSVEQRRAAPLEQRCDYVAGRGIFARFAPWTLDRDRRYYDPPNFWHKPSDFRVRWYKYIGRENRTNKDITGAEWVTILEAVLLSAGASSLDAALQGYHAILRGGPA
jgi:hypothetical protein